MNRRRSYAIAGALVLVVVTTRWWLDRHDPAALVGDPLEPPGRAHVLGTNNVGQDLFGQLLGGAAASLGVALVAAAMTTLIALAVALFGAWSRPIVDLTLDRVLTAFLAVPRLPLLILLGTYAGDSSLATAAIITSVFWPLPARLLRSRLGGLRSAHYIRAAYGFGAAGRYVMRRHVVPELTPILLAATMLTASRAVMIESGLALLGIGDVTRISWGTTIRQALDFGSLFRVDAWIWWLVPPVVAVASVTIGLSLLSARLERRSMLPVRSAAW